MNIGGSSKYIYRGPSRDAAISTCPANLKMPHPEMALVNLELQASRDDASGADSSSKCLQLEMDHLTMIFAEYQDATSRDAAVTSQGAAS